MARNKETRRVNQFGEPVLPIAPQRASEPVTVYGRSPSPISGWTREPADAWAPQERVRVDQTKAEIAEGSPAIAWVQHRDYDELVFKVEITQDGKVVGFHVRPLVFCRQLPVGGVLIDDTGIPPETEHLSARTIRNLPVGEICDAALAAIRPLAFLFELGPDASAWAQTLADKRRPGRRGRPDLFYAQLAAEYVGLLHQPGTNPVPELAKRHHLNESTVRNLLYEARQPRRGLLTAAPAGRAGGELTEKARDLLRAEKG